jgi:hypothetical protein
MAERLEDEEAARVKSEKKEKTLKDNKDKVFVKKKVGFIDHVKEFVHLVKKGFTDVYYDSKYLFGFLAQKGFVESTYTTVEMRERRRIVKDLFKFVPYSLMIVIPLADLLIPFYVILFPNSIPTQFLFESQIGKKVSQLVEKQEKGFDDIKL